MSNACRLAILCLLVLAPVIQGSSAQSDQRYILGTHVSFDVEPTQEPDTDIATTAPLKPGRFDGALSAPPSPRTRSLSTRWIGASNSTSTTLLAPIGLGIVGGTVGFLAGGVFGLQLAEATNCNSWGCALGYPYLGALIGETIGLSSGVYVGTDGGSYLLTLLGGTLGSAVALSLANSTDSPQVLIAAPVIQLAVTIPIAQSN